MLFMGIDIGTQGVRAMVVNEQGTVQSEASRAFGQEQVVPRSDGAFEQDPRVWRRILVETLRATVSGLVAAGHSGDSISALSLTSTSGTLCLVDAAGEPIGPAIMYSDTRSQSVVEPVGAAGAEHAHKLGIRFAASYALTKLVWLMGQKPAHVERARWLTSPTDLALGWISGEYGLMDWTNALKWGYDVADLHWPAFLGDKLDVPMEKVPCVQAPGTHVGSVCPEMAEATGLSINTQVYSGATDGTASQLASGAASLGDWNSTLGTTLVLKGVTDRLIRDREGRLYCHRHPEGYWLPGGASSTGAECISQRFAGADLERLNTLALERQPTDLLVYPLLRVGERFPFRASLARGFVLGEAEDDVERFAAHFEGIAYIERMAYDLVQDLGATVGDTIYSAGGGSNSQAGLQIRADVLGRYLSVPRVPAGAMGAAILAAAGYTRQTAGGAARRMVKPHIIVKPRIERASAYDERFERFRAACRERGYIS